MCKSIGIILQHFKSTKTEGLDTAVNIQELKKQEFDVLCKFIEDSFNKPAVSEQLSSTLKTRANK